MPWSVAGVIDEVTYIGGQLRFHLVLDGGDRLVAMQPNLGNAVFDKDKPVKVWWELIDAYIVKVESG